MEIKLTLNGRSLTASIGADTLLIDLVRDHGCYSVKRGCETANCGLCTVLLDGTPVLSCSVLAARVAGRHVQTLEGLQEEAADFVGFIADQGAEQCGFCNPGFVMNTIALLQRTTTRPTTRSAPILRATCAAARGMRGNCAASERIWTAGRRRGHE